MNPGGVNCHIPIAALNSEGYGDVVVGPDGHLVVELDNDDGRVRLAQRDADGVYGVATRDAKRVVGCMQSVRVVA
jgi:hypothetical protein